MTAGDGMLTALGLLTKAEGRFRNTPTGLNTLHLILES